MIDGFCLLLPHELVANTTLYRISPCCCCCCCCCCCWLYSLFSDHPTLTRDISTTSGPQALRWHRTCAPRPTPKDIFLYRTPQSGLKKKARLGFIAIKITSGSWQHETKALGQLFAIHSHSKSRPTTTPLLNLITVTSPDEARYAQ